MYRNLLCAFLRMTAWACNRLSPPGTIILLVTGGLREGYQAEADIEFRTNLPPSMTIDLLDQLQLQTEQQLGTSEDAVRRAAL